ncbi:MAG: hypothetical protein K1060chlam2_00258 [Chlamydiae bacterium]|nr:hypothetical protein [Chlamydiota bacterium]
MRRSRISEEQIIRILKNGFLSGIPIRKKNHSTIILISSP